MQGLEQREGMQGLEQREGMQGKAGGDTGAAAQRGGSRGCIKEWGSRVRAGGDPGAAEGERGFRGCRGREGVQGLEQRKGMQGLQREGTQGQLSFQQKNRRTFVSRVRVLPLCYVSSFSTVTKTRVLLKRTRTARVCRYCPSNKAPSTAQIAAHRMMQNSSHGCHFRTFPIFCV